MDIAALSMGVNQAQLQNQVSIALIKKILDGAKTQSSGLLQMMNQPTAAPHPTSGHTIDLKG